MVKPRFKWQRNRLYLLIGMNEKHYGCFVVVVIVLVVSTTQKMLGEKQRAGKLPFNFLFLKPFSFSVNGIDIALGRGEEWGEGAFSGL